jgi:hypothetical protein
LKKKFGSLKIIVYLYNVLKQNNMATKAIDFEAITLRLKISHRGGGIEIDLTTLGFKGKRMIAYQNYLGGGMLGRVCIQAYNKPISDKKAEKLANIAEQLKQYFHNLTNPDEEEWESQSYLQNQNAPVSGY